MKKYSKWISIIAAMSLTGALFTGCGTKEGSVPEASGLEEISAEDEQTAGNRGDATAKEQAAKNEERPEVRVLIKWSESQIENWPGLVEEYNADASNPVTIKLEFYGSEGYDDKVKTELMGDNPAGVVQLMKTTFNEYSVNGQLQELTCFLQEQGWDYNKGALAWAGPLNNEGGGVYGIPDFANTSCIFYNTAIFEELGLQLPRNVVELKEVSRTLNDNGYKAIVTGATDWCASDLLAKVQAQKVGADFLIQCYNNEAKYNDSAMVESLEVIKDLVDSNVIDPSSADYTDDDAIAEFTMGNAAMYTAHTGMASAIDAVKDEDFAYDVVETMDFTDNPKTSVSVTWGSMWCIPANVADREAAEAALAFLFGEAVQKNDVEQLGKIVNVDAWNEGLTHPALLTASKQLAGAGTADSFYLLDMVSAKVLDNMNKGIQEMIQGKVSAQEVLDNVQAIWEEECAQK